MSKDNTWSGGSDWDGITPKPTTGERKEGDATCEEITPSRQKKMKASLSNAAPTVQPAGAATTEIQQLREQLDRGKHENDQLCGQLSVERKTQDSLMGQLAAAHVGAHKCWQRKRKVLSRLVSERRKATEVFKIHCKTNVKNRRLKTELAAAQAVIYEALSFLVRYRNGVIEHAEALRLTGLLQSVGTAALDAVIEKALKDERIKTVSRLDQQLAKAVATAQQPLVDALHRLAMRVLQSDFYLQAKFETDNALALANTMTTIQPKKKTEEFEITDIDELHELIKSALRSVTLQYISIRRKLFTGESETTWEVMITHEHAGH